MLPNGKDVNGVSVNTNTKHKSSIVDKQISSPPIPYNIIDEPLKMHTHIQHNIQACTLQLHTINERKKKNEKKFMKYDLNAKYR